MLRNRNETPGRILGLDLLRMLSMVMVIVLHLLAQGGILEAAAPKTAAWYALWGLECLCYCAVDCYGLLSGYLGGGRRRPYGKLAALWLEVLLYSLAYYAVFRCLYPAQVKTQALISALFPMLTRQYWYFTAYFGLTLLLPLLNAGLEKLADRRATGLFFLLLIVFSLLPTLICIDSWRMRGGYTLLWLLLLYLLGALARKSRFLGGLGVLPLLLTAAVCAGMTYAVQLRPVVFPDLGTLSLLNYTSPTVLGFAVCLLLLFGRIRGRAGVGAKLVAGLSAASFGVYILHTNPLLWQLVFRYGCLGAWAELRLRRLLLLVPACALGVYLAFAAVDTLRALLFRLLRLQKGLEKLEDRLAGQQRL